MMLWQKPRRSSLFFLLAECTRDSDGPAPYSAVTRELPNNYPFIVTKQLIISAVSKWGPPADTLFLATSQALRARLTALIEEHFGHYTLLKQRVSYVGASRLFDTSAGSALGEGMFSSTKKSCTSNVISAVYG